MQEMYYSTKRQQFLIDQGYSFKVWLLELTSNGRLFFLYFLVMKYCTCQVITSLPPPEEGPNLSFYTLDEQLELLSKVGISVSTGHSFVGNYWSCADGPVHRYQQVLNAGDDMIGVERLEEDSDGKALLRARRSAGSMSAFSGAGGMVYMEYRCCLSLHFSSGFCFGPYSTSFLTECTGPWSFLSSTGKGKGAPKKHKDPSKRHHLFKKRYA